MTSIIPSTPSDPGLYVSGAGAMVPVSGIINGSGPPSAGSSTVGNTGPWFIEKQNLKIDYIRVPNYDVSSFSKNLSSTTCTYKIQNTFLLSKVTANYSVEKSNEAFNTSVFQQPQTFALFPVATDSYGNSYGSVGVSALGPAGTVETKQEWYHRRLWTSTDAEVVSGVVANRHYYYYRNATGSEVYYPAFLWWGDFSRTLGPFHAGSFLSWNDTSLGPKGSHDDYSLPGNYSTGLETPLGLITYVDNQGMNMTTSQFWPDFWQFNPVYSPLPDKVGLPEYSTARHSW